VLHADSSPVDEAQITLVDRWGHRVAMRFDQQSLRWLDAQMALQPICIKTHVVNELCGSLRHV